MKRASFITNADATEGAFALASRKLFLSSGDDATTVAHQVKSAARRLFADNAGWSFGGEIVGNNFASVAAFTGACVCEDAAKVVSIAGGDFCTVAADFFYDWIIHGIMVGGVGGKTVSPIATAASRRRLSVATISVSPAHIAAARCRASLVRMKMGGCDAWQRSTIS